MRNSALVNLDVEKIIYIIFIIISIMGIIGTNYEEKFLLTKDNNYHKKGSTIFKITITIALLIYLYYLSYLLSNCNFPLPTDYFLILCFN